MGSACGCWRPRRPNSSKRSVTYSTRHKLAPLLWPVLGARVWILVELACTFVGAISAPLFYLRSAIFSGENARAVFDRDVIEPAWKFIRSAANIVGIKALHPPVRTAAECAVLEARCRAQLRVWGLRSLEARMKRTVAAGAGSCSRRS